MCVVPFRRLRIEQLETRALLAGDFQLFADVDARPGRLESSPSDFVRLGDWTLFTALTVEHGRELWRTDGTEAGTSMVKDVAPGFASGLAVTDPASTSALVKFGDAVYFPAFDEATGWELWRTDGTEAGTFRVKDVRPGAANGLSSQARLVEAGGALYFAANDGVHGTELWKTDGTAAGTSLVKDGGFNPTNLVNYGGTLFFRGGSAPGNLWRSDGTAAGTVKVSSKTFTVSSGTTVNMAQANGLLFFIASNSATGEELWRSDGTEAGTMQVKDVYPLNGSSSPAWLTPLGNEVFFTAFDQSHGRELWKTDGTTVGTVMVKDIHVGVMGALDSIVPRMFTFEGLLYFNTRLQQVWVSDGTDAGTVALSQVGVQAAAFSAIDGRLYVAAGDKGLAYQDEHGSDLAWVASPNGRLEAWSAPYNSAGQLYFSGSIGVSGREIITLAGDPPVATVVKELRTGTASANARDLFEFRNELYVTTFSGNGGGAPELWKTDGTSEGTLLIYRFDQYVGGGPLPQAVTIVGDRFFFVVRQMEGEELWTSDGTPAGTRLVKDIYPGPLSSGPSSLHNLNGVLYFLAGEPEHGRELWRSDGTEAGTYLVADAASAIESGRADQTLIVHNGVIYFTTANAAQGRELWRSDGTQSGTYLLKEFVPPTYAAMYWGYAASAGDYLYFFNSNSGGTFDLWRTDGTEQGTTPLGSTELPYALFAFKNQPFFVTSSPVNLGRGLWTVADGQITFISYLDEDRSAIQVIFAEDNFYLGQGNIIWRSDGTPNGTVKIDIPLAAGQFGNAVAVGSVLYLAAGNVLGDAQQVWRLKPSDLVPEPISAFASFGEPYGLVNIAGQLFFTRNDGVHGREPWVYRPSPGDFDGDETVDGQDFLLWQRQFSSERLPGTGADGDANGAIDDGDLDVWGQGFGNQSPLIESYGSQSVAIEAMEETDYASSGSLQSFSLTLNPVTASMLGARVQPASDAAAVDALYAAGDFTTLFAEAKTLRPQRRWRLAR